MILKKVIENDKEIYVPISFEEAVKIHDKTQLVFSSEDEEDEFEEYCKKAMKDDPNTGSTWSVGEFQVEIEPTTQAEVDQVKDLVYNTTAVSGAASSDITNIINEETEAYFSGQKTADEVAKIIQSRMQVYLSETK